MGIKFTNFATSTIANVGGIGSGDVSLDVASGDGNAKFPALSTGDWFYAVLVDTSANREIVKVTARSGDTLTIVRAQDDTSARAFAQDDKVELRLCNQALKDLAHAQDAKTSDYTVTAADIKSSRTFTNEGASGAVNFTLPAGTAGAKLRFIVAVAQYLRVTATSSDAFRMNTDTGASNGYIRSNSIGTVIEIEYVDALSNWVVTSLSGSLSVDE